MSDIDNVVDKDVEETEETVVEKPSKIEKEINDLQSSFNVFLGKNYSIEKDDKDPMILPTGIDVLDAISGGGVGTNLIQFVGNPGSAKSTLSAKILANAQKLYKGKIICSYFDSEQSTDKHRLINLGVNSPPIEPYNSNITVEKIFKMVDATCKYKIDNKELMEYPSIIIWDSIANTLTEKGYEATSVDSVLGEKARVLSSMLPKITNMLKQYNICLLAVNQLRDKIDIGVFKTPRDLRYLSDGSVIPGGKSISFNTFQLYYLRHVKDIDEFGFRGAQIDIKTVKNKLFAPNQTVSLIMSFDRGFSNFWTNFVFLKETKRVKAGAWCSLENYPTVKFRQVQAIKYYKEDPKFRDAWDEAVKESIQKEIIEKSKISEMENI